MEKEKIKTLAEKSFGINYRGQNEGRLMAKDVKEYINECLTELIVGNPKWDKEDEDFVEEVFKSHFGELVD